MKYEITPRGRDFLRFITQYWKLNYAWGKDFTIELDKTNRLAIDYECAWGTSPIEELGELDKMDLKSGRKV